MKENDNFSELFKGFDPEMGSDSDFMSRLERSLTTVDMVMENNRRYVRAGRRLALLSGLVGFVAGVIFMLLLPYFSAMYTSVGASMHSAAFDMLFGERAYTVWATLFVAVPAVGASFLTYSTSLVLSRPSRSA